MTILVHFTEKRLIRLSSGQPFRRLYAIPQEFQKEEALPAQNCILDYCARIDNLPELAHMLGISNSELQKLNLQTVLLMAFERWGHNMFARLRGDWWLAIWDASQQAIILVIDPSSPTTLFYAWSRNGSLAFSPSLAELLKIEDIPQNLHESRMLSFLIHWGRYSDFLQTEYQAIRQIGSGTFNRFRHKEIKTETYWHPDQFRLQNNHTSEEYVEEFLGRYRQAVANRIPKSGNVASMLSAGLDSGSVTAIAAKTLQTDNRQVHAYTHVPVKEAADLHVPGKLVNEWPHAAQLAAMYPNIQHIEVNSEHINPLKAAVYLLKSTGRMQAANPNVAWIYSLHDLLRQGGFSTLLSGQAGNVTISWEGSRLNIWDLILRKEWSQVAPYLHMIKKRGALALLRRLAGDSLNYLHPSREFPGTRFTPQLTNIAHPDLCRHWQSAFEEDARIHRGAIKNHREFRDQMFPMLTAACSFSQLIAASFDITISDPTSDQHVVEWCLQIPDKEYCDAAQNRLLIRNAMAGLMPESTRLSQIRGLQPADLGYRYHRYRESVEHTLNLMRQSPLAEHYLNLNQISQNWFNCQKTRHPGKELYDFHQGLQAGLFFLICEGTISEDDF